MNTKDYYRPVKPEWCQGDIIQGVPHIHLKQTPLKALRPRQSAKGEVFDPYPYDTDELLGQAGVPTPRPDFHFSQGEQIAAAFCQVAYGILLSNDCELDKDDKHRLVALIRPLGGIGVQEKDRQTIRDGKKFSYFYLPAYSDVLGESYVDLRRLTSVAPEFLKEDRRVVSLTDAALAYLYTQFFRYLTRRDLDPAALERLVVVKEAGE